MGTTTAVFPNPTSKHSCNGGVPHPEDYQHKLLEAQPRLRSAYDGTEAQKQRLTAALDRLKELHKWGDKTREEYLAESREISSARASLDQPADDRQTMARLADFLRNVAAAWRQADEQQRNKLARTLFDAVWIENQRVLAVTPRPELKPFFDLQYSELSSDVLQWRPRRDSNP